jgi:hypothetical protein
MSRSQYLTLAGIAGLFFVVLTAGVALIVMPWLLNLGGPQTPVESPTPVVTLPAGSQTALPSAFPTETAATLPTGTPTTIPTATTIPTSTTIPTATSTPTPTPIPIPCDWAAFVADVTVKDGAVFAPSVSFTKTWRIRNIGSCTWNTDYDLAFGSGSPLDAPVSVPLAGTVRPGETIDVSVPMQAPDDEGSYTGYWQLRNPAGMRFGLGDDRTGAFWIRIIVDLPCYWAGFVGDVTIPDNTAFTPDAGFVKIWRLKNIGDCDWTTGFDVIHIGGDKMNATVADIPKLVEPGETVDVQVALNAPGEPGDYRGYWLIETTDGDEFGMGDLQDSPFWVDIKVLDTDNDYVYDFAANFCLAVWKGGQGVLSCPGSDETNGAFVLRLEKPDLENRTENEPALWTAPDADPDGWISGKFPAVFIEEGDHFKAWVGCLDGAEGCEVTFYLNYQIGSGEVKSLGSWDEVYDGEITEIDIDLSFLAGEHVTFILIAEVDGGEPDEADAFWFSPRIE